jgi:hypothetical protein
MSVRKSTGLTYADVTPRSVYLDRRKFLPVDRFRQRRGQEAA